MGSGAGKMAHPQGGAEPKWSVRDEGAWLPYDAKAQRILTRALSSNQTEAKLTAWNHEVTVDLATMKERSKDGKLREVAFEGMKSPPPRVLKRSISLGTEEFESLEAFEHHLLDYLVSHNMRYTDLFHIVDRNRDGLILRDELHAFFVTEIWPGTPRPITERVFSEMAQSKLAQSVNFDKFSRNIEKFKRVNALEASRNRMGGGGGGSASQRAKAAQQFRAAAAFSAHSTVTSMQRDFRSRQGASRAAAAAATAAASPSPASSALAKLTSPIKRSSSSGSAGSGAPGRAASSLTSPVSGGGLRKLPSSIEEKVHESLIDALLPLPHANPRDKQGASSVPPGRTPFSSGGCTSWAAALRKQPAQLRLATLGAVAWAAAAEAADEAAGAAQREREEKAGAGGMAKLDAVTMDELHEAAAKVGVRCGAMRCDALGWGVPGVSQGGAHCALRGC